MSTAVTFALNNQDQLTLQRLSGPLGANFDALSKSLNVKFAAQQKNCSSKVTMPKWVWLVYNNC